jgi:serine/threonine protein kinase
MEGEFLATDVIKATASTLKLTSEILGFKIVELWSEDLSGSLKCTYAHVDSDIIKIFPDVIHGHYPEHKKEHIISPKLCLLAKDSGTGYIWRVNDGLSSGSTTINSFTNTNTTKDDSHLTKYRGSFNSTIKTEMAYMLHIKNKLRVYIVGFSTDSLPYRFQKIKFLRGIGYAMYVAAFDLEEERYSDDDVDIENALLEMTDSFPCIDIATADLNTAVAPLSPSSDLDVKVFLPRPASHTNLQQAMKRRDSESEIVLPTPSQLTESTAGTSPLADSANEDNLGEESSDRRNSLERKAITPHTSRDNLRSSYNSLEHAESNSRFRNDQSDHDNNISIPGSSHHSVPNWDPIDLFSFPVFDLPLTRKVPSNLTLDNFKDVKHIADGSNSNIFLAQHKSFRVIIKMIKDSVQLDPIASHEFDVEHGILNRVTHPNIIKLLGSGRYPRRFIVLEYLGGGSLNSILNDNQAKPGIAQMLFSKPSFTYASLLSKARDIADALDYLHSKVHDGASIIHRDLKPDNVGFTMDGKLKLFDFGLCTCVKRRQSSNESYEMTGNTGSLRYMAPEVALKAPYSEKADVYSFGIMIWQMARDRVPFKGMTREAFMTNVVRGGERPKLDRSWPAGFSQLLTDCWNENPEIRPSFSTIKSKIDELSNNIGKKSITTFISGGASASSNREAPLKKGNSIIGGKKAQDTKSSWF